MCHYHLRCKSLIGSVLQEERVDQVMEIGQREAEETMRALARVEGIFAGTVHHSSAAPKGYSCVTIPPIRVFHTPA